MACEEELDPMTVRILGPERIKTLAFVVAAAVSEQCREPLKLGNNIEKRANWTLHCIVEHFWWTVRQDNEPRK